MLINVKSYRNPLQNKLTDDQTNLVSSSGYSSTAKTVQMMILRPPLHVLLDLKVTLVNFLARLIYCLVFYVGKCLNIGVHGNKF